jgi:DNA-binding LytR/AlgR family response regulator
MNCLVVDDEDASRMVVKNFITQTPNLQLIAECNNAIDALNILKTKSIDVVFLDVEMPQMSGIELVQALDSLPQIVLITGKKDVGSEAYEYNLTDYLIKPITYPRFLKAIEKVEQNLSNNILETKGGNNIYIKTDNKIIRVKLDDIHYIEALSDYMIIHTDNKKFVIHSTMKSLERRLPSSEFMRIHRSYIVNLTKIESIEDTTIFMNHKQIQVPVGASYKNDFLARLNML